MKRVQLSDVALAQLREIRSYSRKRWGAARADAYIRALSAKFDEIARSESHSRQVPALFGVEGWFCSCEAHFIYWRPLGRDVIAIVAVLHQRMHQRDRVRTAFADSP